MEGCHRLLCFSKDTIINMTPATLISMSNLYFRFMAKIELGHFCTSLTISATLFPYLFSLELVLIAGLLQYENLHEQNITAWYTSVLY
jgi:hypothetical protein